jgi:hypothetical protein
MHSAHRGVVEFDSTFLCCAKGLKKQFQCLLPKYSKLACSKWPHLECAHCWTPISKHPWHSNIWVMSMKLLPCCSKQHRQATLHFAGAYNFRGNSGNHTRALWNGPVVKCNSKLTTLNQWSIAGRSGMIPNVAENLGNVVIVSDSTQIPK